MTDTAKGGFMKKECKHKKKILGRLNIECFLPDSEPYREGQEVDLPEIAVNETIYGHYCPECERIIDVWVES